MSDALARPAFAPFHVEAIYEWIECDLAKYPGFAVEVRMNLKNRERKALNDLLDDVATQAERITTNAKARGKEIDERRTAALEQGDIALMDALLEERVQLIEQAGAAHDHNAARIRDAITPYIRNWNLAIRNDDGTIDDIPPPAEIGVDAFDDLDQTLVNWLASTLLQAYRGGKGFLGSPLTAGEPDAPGSESSETTPGDAQPDSLSESDQPSPQSLRSPSPSHSTG